jgi:ABC-type antimicrobial peptide transport system permease subunit
MKRPLVSSGAAKGTLLAAANAITIALGFSTLGLVVYGPMLGCFLIIAISGLVIGLPIGALVGWIAERLSGTRRHVRLVVLGSIPLIPMALLTVLIVAGTRNSGRMLEGLYPILLACIPTLISVAILEKWTRREVDPTVPAAIARA